MGADSIQLMDIAKDAFMGTIGTHRSSELPFSTRDATIGARGVNEPIPTCDGEGRLNILEIRKSIVDNPVAALTPRLGIVRFRIAGVDGF